MSSHPNCRFDCFKLCEDAELHTIVNSFLPHTGGVRSSPDARSIAMRPCLALAGVAIAMPLLFLALAGVASAIRLLLALAGVATTMLLPLPGGTGVAGVGVGVVAALASVASKPLLS